MNDIAQRISDTMNVSPASVNIVTRAENALGDVFAYIESIEQVCTARVLRAFTDEGVALRHFTPTTGYGYDDTGRDTLDRVFAHALQSEDAIVRPQLTSGTHAIYMALAGLTEPGDSILSASGKPYDTLENVLGISGVCPNSLRRSGVSFSYVPLDDNGKIDVEAVHGRLENLRIFKELGVQAMTLTWNATNELASLAMTRRDKGLTVLGRDVIREMEKIHIALDVAHLGDRGIDDALDRTDAPIFSSHTNARAVFPHKRSISDRHIREIAARGGVIGVNYYSPQLVGDGRASIADVIRHIAHIAEVGGPKCVMLGSDFEGMGAQSYPVGLSSWADVPKLLEELERAGFSKDEIQDIAYCNLARYLKYFV